jgi:alpha-tubulin suppressor-like RCC1 family protein
MLLSFAQDWFSDAPCRGNGQQAQLGRKIIERRKTNGLEPERLALRDIVCVGSGSYHSFAVDKAGVVYAWVRHVVANEAN